MQARLGHPKPGLLFDRHRDAYYVPDVSAPQLYNCIFIINFGA